MGETRMPEMDIREVLKYLPHRYPFLLIDRVLEINPGESLVAIKNVTYNEEFFQGHFPGRPVMPGVLILEAMAQATGVLAYYSLPPVGDNVYYIVGVDNARFRRPVEPGDQIRIEVKLMRRLRGIWKAECKASVDDQLVSEAGLLAALSSKESES